MRIGTPRTIAVLLAVLLLGLVGAVGATASASDDPRHDLRRAAWPWADPESALTRAHRDVAEAARAQTLAFLAVDYRDMDRLTADVLAGATGAFAAQYAERLPELVSRARRTRSLSVGEIVALGVGDLDRDAALVYVAANTQVSNTATDGETQTRYYRLQLTLEKVDGRWLTSSIQFVG